MIKPPVIVAHRGLHQEHPENSLAAFGAAWDAGIAWCECDVHLSADGQFIVIHDATLQRTTLETGPVVDRSADALGRCCLRGADGVATEHRLATLHSVLQAMPAHATMHVEIKPALPVEYVWRTASVLQGRRCVVQSFEQANLFHVRKFDAELPLAWLIDRREDLTAAIQSPWPAVHLEHSLLDETIARQLRGARKIIGVWTVNEPADIRRVLALGVDRIITDYPQRVRDATKSQKSNRNTDDGNDQA